jgi:endonuclease/exonuclease/phosphatase family metal-dependent hydrolase
MHDNRKLRVVAQNVWARHGDWPRRQQVLRAGLRAADPDLVVFVEAVRTDEYDLVEDLLGPGYEIVYESHLDREGVGTAVASRWPIERVHELALAVTDRTAHLDDATLAVEIVAPEPIGPLLFVGANPKWELRYERERELQALLVARFAEHHALEHGGHVVLAGDFDDVPDAASIRFITGRQSLDGVSVCYRDAWASTHPTQPGHTFTPENPLVRDGETAWDVPRRIDYIFVRCDNHGPTLEVARCERLFEAPVDGAWASDHFGVVAELTVR